MFFCLLIKELCTKEENDKTGCNFNFGHECILNINFCIIPYNKSWGMTITKSVENTT